MSRDYRSRETQSWLRTGQMALSERIQGEQRLPMLGEQRARIPGGLPGRAGRRRLHRGGRRPLPSLRRLCAAGRRRRRGAARRRRPGRPGGQGEPHPAREGRADGYLPVASGLGRGTPATLLVAPAAVDGVVHAVVELGFFRDVRPADQELLARVSESLGVAVRASKDRTRLEELLEETQRQAEELQTQQEELRVTNEELEEQGRALRESRRGWRRSRRSSNRSTRSSRSRPSCWSTRRTTSRSAGRPHRPRRRTSSARISTRASSWPT